jgi:hypothetical protein
MPFRIPNTGKKNTECLHQGTCSSWLQGICSPAWSHDPTGNSSELHLSNRKQNVYNCVGMHRIMNWPKISGQPDIRPILKPYIGFSVQARYRYRISVRIFNQTFNMSSTNEINKMPCVRQFLFNFISLMTKNATFNVFNKMYLKISWTNTGIMVNR